MSQHDRQPVLRSEFAGDPEMGELVELFVSELPERVEALLGALRDGDVLRLRTTAHQLKGAAGGYGFPTIGDAAKRVEDCIRAEGSSAGCLEKVRSDLDGLVELCRRATAMPG